MRPTVGAMVHRIIQVVILAQKANIHPHLTITIRNTKVGTQAMEFPRQPQVLVVICHHTIPQDQPTVATICLEALQSVSTNGITPFMHNRI